MIGRMILCFVIIFQWTLLAESKCNYSLVEREIPFMDIKMNTEIRMIEGEPNGIDCCMNAVTTITWTYKKNSFMKTWSIINETNDKFELDNFNRTLYLANVIKKDEGLYKCTGANANGTILFFVSKVFVDKSTAKDRTIKIVNISDSQIQSYRPGSDLKLYCVFTMKHDFIPFFEWTREDERMNRSLIKREYLSARYNNDTLINGHQGFCNVTMRTFDKYESMYNLTLTIFSLDMSHGGQYCCKVRKVKSWEKNRCLHINIYPVYEDFRQRLIGIIAFLIFCVIIFYAFHYELKVITKDVLRAILNSGNSGAKYNFLFVYDFHHNEEFKNIHSAVSLVESRGYSTYFHHRDQIYGKDLLENIQMRIRDSNVIVIWAMNPALLNSILDFCVQKTLNNLYQNKRIYVFGSRKKIQKLGQSKIISSEIRSFFTSKVFVLNCKESTNSILRKWKDHRFVTWLISNLPLKQQSDQDEEKSSYDNKTYL